MSDNGPCRRSARLALRGSVQSGNSSALESEVSNTTIVELSFPVAGARALPKNDPPPFASKVPQENIDLTGCTGPKLCQEQRDLVDTILGGRNVFYTGSAGCGKSTVLKASVQELQQMGKRVHIVAPTGRAALDINGSTIHVYAGWKVGDDAYPLERLERAAHRDSVWRRLNSTHVLVIDEISMVENLLFERLNAIMKAARNSSKPFGGVQMVVTGDFCQLPPIKPFAHCIKCGTALEPNQEYKPTAYHCKNTKCRQHTYYDKDKWAFRSQAWKECNFVHMNLITIHQQKDAVFINILNKFRNGECLSFQDRKLLLDHPSNAESAIELFPKRDDVERLNQEKVDALPVKPHTYKCIDHLKWKIGQVDASQVTKLASDGTLEALREHRYEPKLQLKVGMRVVLLQNLDFEAGLVNGSQGVILRFDKYDKAKMPVASYNTDRNVEDAIALGAPVLIGSHARYRERQIRSFIEQVKYQAWPVVQFGKGPKRVIRTIYADCTVNWHGADHSSMLSRTQIPLMPGYAITVHKAQGMSLSRVRINLENAFERSQLYVALSRARSLNGLKVVALPKRPLALGNEEVLQFMAHHFGKG